MTNRISKYEYYLNIALAVSKRSTCLKRHYGAVIVKNDEIVATGYNGAARNEPNCCDIHTECPRKNAKHNSGDYSDCPAVHAEQNALLSASRDKTIGATLYLNGYNIIKTIDIYHDPLYIEKSMKECEPCPICKRMIMNAGIIEIIGPQGIIWSAPASPDAQLLLS